VLEDGDEPNAPIDGITEADLGLVGEGVCRVFPLRHMELVQELGHVARAEDLMDIGKLLGLVRGEVGGEHALRGTFPALELARSTRGAQRRHNICPPSMRGNPVKENEYQQLQDQREGETFKGEIIH